MEYMKIKIFMNRTEAEIAKSFLAARGIESRIVSDDQNGLRPSLSLTNGVSVLVEKESIEAANNLMKEVFS